MKREWVAPRADAHRDGGFAVWVRLSIWHWIVVVIVVLLLFGRGKISDLMGDVAQGIKAFKKGMSEDETAQATPPKSDVPPRTLENEPKAAPRPISSAAPRPSEGRRRYGLSASRRRKDRVKASSTDALGV